MEFQEPHCPKKEFPGMKYFQEFQEPHCPKKEFPGLKYLYEFQEPHCPKKEFPGMNHLEIYSTRKTGILNKSSVHFEKHNQIFNKVTAILFD